MYHCPVPAHSPKGSLLPGEPFESGFLVGSWLPIQSVRYWLVNSLSGWGLTSKLPPLLGCPDDQCTSSLMVCWILAVPACHVVLLTLTVCPELPVVEANAFLPRLNCERVVDGAGISLKCGREMVRCP